MYVHHYPHSHGWNMLAKALCFVLGLALMGVVIVAVNGLVDLHALEKRALWIAVLVLLGSFLVPLLLSWLLIYRPLLSPLATWLFLRVSRKTRVPWRDCVALTPLFVLDRHGLWYPVEELPGLPEDQRVAHLYALAERAGRIPPGSGKAPVSSRFHPVASHIGRSRPASDVSQHAALTRAMTRVPDRLLGAILLAMGLGCAELGIFAPLRALAARAPSVHYPHEATIAAPPLLAVAVAYLVLGQRATRLLALKGTQRPTRLGWALALVFVAVGITLQMWLASTLARAGYRT